MDGLGGGGLAYHVERLGWRGTASNIIAERLIDSCSIRYRFGVMGAHSKILKAVITGTIGSQDNTSR